MNMFVDFSLGGLGLGINVLVEMAAKRSLPVLIMQWINIL